MKKRTHSYPVSVLLCLLASLCQASELDILSGSARGLKPNVVMLIDTSDSLSGFATDARFGTSDLGGLTACDASAGNCRLSQFIAAYANQFTYLNRSNGFKKIKATISSGRLENFNLNFIPKMDFINDLIREGVYQSYERGGFNLSIMGASKNNDGLRSGRKPVRRASSLSPADAADNGAFVLFGFRETDSIGSVDQLVNRISNFKGNDQRSGDLLRSRGTNHIWIESGEFGVVESLHESVRVLAGLPPAWQKSSWSGLADMRTLDDWVDNDASVGGLDSDYVNQWDNLPLECNTTNHTVIYADDTPAWDWQANTMVMNHIAGMAPAVPPPNANASAEHDTSASSTLLDEYINAIAGNDLSGTAVGQQHVHTHIMSFEGGSLEVVIPPPPPPPPVLPPVEPPPPPVTGRACLDCSTGRLRVDPSCPGGWDQRVRELSQNGIALDCPSNSAGNCSCGSAEKMHVLNGDGSVDITLRHIESGWVKVTPQHRGNYCLDVDKSRVFARKTSDSCPKWRIRNGVLEADVKITLDTPAPKTTTTRRIQPPPPPPPPPPPRLAAKADPPASGFYASMVSNTRGAHESVSDYKTMAQAQARIFDNIMAIHNSSTTLTGYRITRPASAANPLLLGDDVYVSLYNQERNWVGNIKRYKMRGGVIMDALGNPAFNEFGRLNPSSKDFWNSSSSTDGDSLLKGGLASKLNPDAGNRYVQLLANSGKTRRALSRMGLAPEVLDYALGKDEMGNNANRLWDAMYATPAVFHYRRGETDAISRLFTTNNGGFLHAFDPANGSEAWAIMPEPLLQNLSNLQAGATNKVYGLDGGITLWHNDLNGDTDLLTDSGAVDTDPDSPDDAESLYVFATARRGGSLISAIDATNRNLPKPAWLISDANADFASLGQTWAKPALTHVENPAESKPTAVLLVPGGYDPQYDNPNFKGIAAKGAGIYMIDAKDGKLLWAAGQDGESVNGMNYSFVSQIRPYDTDADGTLDLFYALDIMGQIFRCDVADLPEGATSPPGKSDIDCGLVIALDKSKTRRFYADLDSIVTTNAVGILGHIALSVGSGNLVRPLDNQGYLDRFYVVFDDAIKGSEPQFAKASERSLKTASAWASDPELSPGLQGYYLELGPTEKALSRASTHQYRLTFQSYYPTPIPDCRRPPLDGRIYAFNIMDAKALSASKGPQPRSGVKTRGAGGSLIAKTVTAGTGLPQSSLVNYNYDKSGNLEVEVCSGGGGDCVTLPTVDATNISYMSDDE